MNKSQSQTALISLSILGLAACSGGGGLFGPPDDVSREYAAELIEAQPAKSGEPFKLPTEVMKCLASEGYIKYQMLSQTQSVVTSKGQPYFQASSWPAFSPHGTITPYSDIQFSNITVTGIRTVQEDRQAIEFTAKPVLQGLTSICLSMAGSEPRTALAERYDDGWRIKYATRIK